MITDTLKTAAETAIAACRAAGARVATAESCTGGLIGGALTAIAGSSDVVDAGFITYSNKAKETLLDVPPSLIRAQGAVSREVAIAMARGALARSSATVAIAVTGIAGPGGGSDRKPVGLIHLAAAVKTGMARHRRMIFNGDRNAIREQTVAAGLGMIVDILEKTDE